MMNSYSMTQLAASVAAAMGAEAPKESADPIPAVVQLVERGLGGMRIGFSSIIRIALVTGSGRSTRSFFCPSRRIHSWLFRWPR